MRARSAAAAILVLAALGAAAAWRLAPGEGSVAAPPQVAVTRGTVAETVLVSGMLEAHELVSVGARVSGQVETLAVALGDVVAEGDLIARIDSQDQQNEVLQAEAALANLAAQITSTEATIDKSERALARLQTLQGGSYATEEDVEAATADLRVARADLEALEAQKSSAAVTLATARVALERTRITAPIAGTVVAVVVKQGQTVNSSQSAPTIVKIADLSTMVVKAEVSEADVMKVAPGQAVTFTTLGAPDAPFRATLREIEPAPDEIAEADTIDSETAVYYNALMEVANPDGRLRIGMSAEVSIELGRAEDVLTVPAAALRSTPRGSAVGIWDPAARQVRPQRVEVGLNDKVTAEIRDGLSEGQRIVAGGGLAAAAPAGAARGTGRMRPPPMF
ncbi:efflux RND transporter periplasmic adaptor subunit [Mangrovicoccus algicola]|uniref:Efflux RND transporter periplasmic adaptor subunit n=1 Tax=Mangrovicoccus algicola TaxID=2771008 RepID=A0A8J6YZK7_9RHOB|nr:efflux RND transporter periplasmic adaptor subunit [Mangrovicoccus algicola]MBE3638871.1 efflux RND transporter periplasmic adaptor subunit [Mangrovicoccus algicola]